MAFSRIKRKSTTSPDCKDEKPELVKKPKMDLRVNDAKAAIFAASSTCSDSNTGNLRSPLTFYGLYTK